MLECGKFVHVSVTVKDLQETEEFYSTVLGFKTTSKLFNLDCPDYGGVTGVEGACLNCMFMEGHGLVLEFTQYISPKGKTIDAMPNDIGASHICFETSEGQPMYDMIKASGVKMLSPKAVTISFGPHKGNTAWYFKDPNGYIIEMTVV